MANCSSAKKMIRVIERRTLVNDMRRSKMRTAMRRAKDAFESQDKDAALSAFRKAESVIQKCVGKGVIHRNTAARKIKKLYARVKSIPDA